MEEKKKKKAYGLKGQTCMEGKKEKKKLMDEMKRERKKKCKEKTYGWNETRERRNNIKF